MMAMAAEKAIFENEDWVVSESGLEHKSTGYFIARESLAQRRSDGLWTWPLHMAEKTWCAMTPFTEAFCCAASVYNVETGADLAQTFRMARSEIVAWPRRIKQNGNLDPLAHSVLQNGHRNPISWTPGCDEESLKDMDDRSGEHARERGRTASQGPIQTMLRMRKPKFVKFRIPAASRRLHKSGTKLVRLLQAAWTIR